MFDTFVAGQLNIWASWWLRKADGGMGYPKKVSFLKVAPQASSHWTPEMDSQALAMDKCVMALDGDLYAAIEACYLHTTTVAQKAEYCGCQPQTYYNRLGRAHKELLGFMNDLAAGIALKVIPRPKKIRRKLKQVA